MPLKNLNVGSVNGNKVLIKMHSSLGKDRVSEQAVIVDAAEAIKARSRIFSNFLSHHNTPKEGDND